jgi:hypothetical protein
MCLLVADRQTDRETRPLLFEYPTSKECIANANVTRTYQDQETEANRQEPAESV